MELEAAEPNQYVYRDGGKWYGIKELNKEGSETFPSKEWEDHPQWDESRLGEGEKHFVGETTTEPVTLKEVEFIVLHSTISTKSESVSDDKKAHFVIERDGTIRYLIHIEKERPEDGKAAPHAGLSSWNGIKNLNEHSIGIEVVAAEGENWSTKEYESVKALVQWLGGYFELSKNAVLRHSQVAYGDSAMSEELDMKMCDGRGRKLDPIDADLFLNLGLLNNDRLNDVDEVTGAIPTHAKNFKAIKNPTLGQVAGMDLRTQGDAHEQACNE